MDDRGRGRNSWERVQGMLFRGSMCRHSVRASAVKNARHTMKTSLAVASSLFCLPSTATAAAPADLNQPGMAPIYLDRATEQTRCADEWSTEDFWLDTDTSTVAACLEDGRLEANWRDSLGVTPLHFAARYSREPRVLELLISNGARPEARHQSNRRTPLHYAARWNSSSEVVNTLVSNGADVHARNDRHRTPLHLAARYSEHASVVRALVVWGDSIESKDSTGWTPLHLAASGSEHPHIVRELIRLGADLDAQAHDGRSPLDLAERRSDANRENIVRELREAEQRRAPDRHLLPSWLAAIAAFAAFLVSLVSLRRHKPKASVPG